MKKRRKNKIKTSKFSIILFILLIINICFSGYLLYKINWVRGLLKDLTILYIYNNKDFQNDFRNNNDPNNQNDLIPSPDDNPKKIDPFDSSSKNKMQKL